MSLFEPVGKDLVLDLEPGGHGAVGLDIGRCPLIAADRFGIAGVAIDLLDCPAGNWCDGKAGSSAGSKSLLPMPMVGEPSTVRRSPKLLKPGVSTT